MLTVYGMTLFYPLEQKEINVELLNCSIFMYKTLGGFCADFVLSTVNVIFDLKKTTEYENTCFVCGKKTELKS